MDYIINIEIITLRNTVGGRRDAGTFGKRTRRSRIGTYATDAARVAAAARCSEHMADVVIRTADDRS